MNNILDAYERKTLHYSFYEILIFLEVWKKILPLTQEAVVSEKGKEADWIKSWENKQSKKINYGTINGKKKRYC